MLLSHCAPGCGPAFLDNLANTAYRQRVRGHVSGDAGAGANISSVAHSYRRHQRGIAADKSVLADDCLVLVHPVVVAGDGPRADVGSRAHLHIAQVSEVTGLRALGQLGFLVSTKLPM